MTKRLLACIVVIAVGCDRPAPTNNHANGSSEKGKPARTNGASSNLSSGAAENVELAILDNDDFQSLVASKRGKIVVVDAWATSCPTCVQEFPNFVAFSKKYPDDVACISLSFDYEGLDSPEEIRGPILDFLKSQNAAFDNVLSSVPSDELYQKLDLYAVPAAFVYDREGKLVKRFDESSSEGYTYKDVEAYVQSLLKWSG